MFCACFCFSYCSSASWDLFTYRADLLNKEWLWGNLRCSNALQNGIRSRRYWYSDAGTCCCMFVLGKMTVNSPLRNPDLCQRLVRRITTWWPRAAQLQNCTTDCCDCHFPFSFPFILCPSCPVLYHHKMLLWMYLLISPHQHGLSCAWIRLYCSFLCHVFFLNSCSKCPLQYTFSS